MLTPKFLILAGDGINCERESAQAFELSGAVADIVHINELLGSPRKLNEYQGMALPGGFSFGDELGSGQLMALKIVHGLGDLFREFVARGNPVIGICNGFQVLCKMGILPGMGLAHNERGQFIDRWVELDRIESICKWTVNVKEKIALPVRHGEGRVVFSNEGIYKKMLEAGQIVLRYREDVNGSYERVAGVCDSTGLVFGLMPHPEAYLYNILKKSQAPDPFGEGDGRSIFTSIIDFIKEK